MRVLLFTVLTAVAGVQGEGFTEFPDGYIVNTSVGKAYKVMYQAQNWARANYECEQIGSSLAVPQSQDEFQFLQKLIRGMYYPYITGTRYKLLVWLGINNLEEYDVWRNIDGDDINETGFSKWASNHVGYSDDPHEPHCAGMDAVNPGLRDYWCHLRQPYICQIQLITHGQPDYSNVNEDEEHFLHERNNRTPPAPILTHSFCLVHVHTSRTPVASTTHFTLALGFGPYLSYETDTSVPRFKNVYQQLIIKSSI